MSVIVNGNEIVLSGVVGDLGYEDCFTAEQVIIALAEIGRSNPVSVRINSPGGIATEGVAIYNALASHRGKVTIEVDAIAASAASVIAMAGDETVMRTGSVMMIHDPANITIGTAADHLKSAGALNVQADSLAEIYALKTGRSVAAMRDVMREEVWLTAKDAVSQKFADRVSGTKSSKPTAFNYRLFTNAPERMVAMADASGWSTRKTQAAAPAATSHMENAMSTDPAGTPAPVVIPPVAPAAPAAVVAVPQTNVVELDAARAQARSDALAYVREINHICALAGAPDQAQAFIDKDAKPADVARELLESRASADAARQVSGHHQLQNTNQKPVAKFDLAADMRRRHGITA